MVTDCVGRTDSLPVGSQRTVQQVHGPNLSSHIAEQCVFSSEFSEVAHARIPSNPPLSTMKRAGAPAQNAAARPASTQQNLPSLSLAALVAGQLLQYLAQRHNNDFSKAEETLKSLGRVAGIRVLESFGHAEWRNSSPLGSPLATASRGSLESKVLPLLNFVAGPVWKTLFGHAAEVLKAPVPSEGVPGGAGGGGAAVFQIVDKTNTLHLCGISMNKLYSRAEWGKETRGETECGAVV